MYRLLFRTVLVAATLMLGAFFLWQVWTYGQTYIQTKRVSQQLPDDPFMRGEYHFERGGGEYDLEKARQHYGYAIAASSTQYEQAWYQLGRIDFLEGKFDAAIHKFQRQREYFGDSVPKVHYMLGLTYAYNALMNNVVDDWTLAEAAFKTYLIHDPYSPWAHVDFSWVLFSQGKYEEMLPVLEAGLTYTSDNPWLQNMYGLALMNTGDTKQAHEYFLKAYESAQELTPAQWGAVYPGNDPGSWRIGLDTFKEAIQKNIALTE